MFKVLDDARNNEIFFGRQVAAARDSDTGKSFLAKYDLSARPYMGPTSTDHELAFLMANQAQVKPAEIQYSN